MSTRTFLVAKAFVQGAFEVGEEVPEKVNSKVVNGFALWLLLLLKLLLLEWRRKTGTRVELVRSELLGRTEADALASAVCERWWCEHFNFGVRDCQVFLV